MPRRNASGDASLQSANITTNSRGGIPIEAKYAAQSFTNATWIEGGSLKRYWKRMDLAPSKSANLVWCLVFTPSDHQLEEGCDTCASAHLKKNMSCSMNQQTPTPKHELGVLYKFKKYSEPEYTFMEMEEFKDVPPGEHSVYGTYVQLFVI
jgi:hypothetical protein